MQAGIVLSNLVLVYATLNLVKVSNREAHTHEEKIVQEVMDHDDAR